MSSEILAFQDNYFQLLNNILKKLSLQTKYMFLKILHTCMCDTGMC